MSDYFLIILNTIVPLAVILVFEKKRQNMPNRARKVARPIMVSGRRNTRSLLLSYSYLSACAGTLLRLCALPVHALRQVIIIVIVIISIINLIISSSGIIIIIIIIIYGLLPLPPTHRGIV